MKRGAEVAKRPNAPVLKTGGATPLKGSNPFLGVFFLFVEELITPENLLARTSQVQKDQKTIHEER